MENTKEEKILENTLDLEDKKVALLIINYFKDIKSIKSDMVGSLNLLDDVAEGNKSKKDILRSKILDNYNELPRKTLNFVEELIYQLKE